MPLTATHAPPMSAILGPRHGRRSVAASHRQKSRPRGVPEIVPRPPPVRAGLPEPGERAHHQPRKRLPQRRVPQPQPVHHPRPEPLHQHVAPGEEPPHHLHPLGALQVQDQRALAPVEGREQLTRAAGRHRPRGIALRRLELHHLRTEVREDERRVGSRSEPRQIQYPHARERQSRMHLGLGGSAQVSSFRASSPGPCPSA